MKVIIVTGATANENDKIEGFGYQAVDYFIMNEAYKIIDSEESLVANEKIKENPLENHEFVFIDVSITWLILIIVKKSVILPNPLCKTNLAQWWLLVFCRK